MAPLPRWFTRWNAMQPRSFPGFEKQPFLDRAFWLDIDPNSEPWIAALEAFDKRDDKGPLIELFRSGPPPQEVCKYLADFLERQLKRKRGNQATPLYDLSEKDQALLAGVYKMKLRAIFGRAVSKETLERISKLRNIPVNQLQEYRGLRAVSFKEALEKISKLHDIPVNQLEDAYRGRRGTMRRRAKALSRKA